jgi:hypothetical protein
MCEKCEPIDQTLEQYTQIARVITDQLTLDRIKAMVADLTGKKVAMHLGLRPA